MRIVLLGGGTGQAQVLRGLLRYPVQVTSVVNVTDNGGHTGALRRALRIPAVGDVRNCLSAAAPKGHVIGELLRGRFLGNEMDGTSVGNLMLSYLTLRRGSLSRATAELARAMGARASVLPVSDGSADVCARLTDGRVIRGEWQILLRRPRAPIREIFLRPPLRCLPEAARAIRNADRIVIGPGALLTAVTSVLSVRGVAEAIARSKGSILFVCNLLTFPGQTDGWTAARHVEWVSRYLPRKPDAVVLNTGRPPAWAIRRYRALGAEMVRDDLDQALRADLVAAVEEERGGQGRFLSLPHSIRHDPGKLARILVGWNRSVRHSSRRA